ncbi:MAG: hypothetical protein JTJ18_11700, partial [Streptococcus sp.]|nr:hypothetical protein [Streptococcus sp.]
MKDTIVKIGKKRWKSYLGQAKLCQLLADILDLKVGMIITFGRIKNNNTLKKQRTKGLYRKLLAIIVPIHKILSVIYFIRKDFIDYPTIPHKF